MNEQDLNDLIEAGKICSRVREYGASLIKEGSRVVEVLDLVEEKIHSMGGEYAFPAQISINEVAAHFCPQQEDETKFQKGDVVKIDCGVHVNGMVADSAKTVALGGNEKLVEASRAALNNAIKKVSLDIEIRDIGKEIDETITGLGFKSVKNLSGHGVGKFMIHAPPSIPNYDNGDSMKLAHDMMIAIEPFASTGAGFVEQESNAEVFELVGKKPVRSMITRKVLNEIVKFNGLPFTTRWLTKKFSLPQVNYALKDLYNHRILRMHPPLVDKDKGMVSQAEHTLLIGEEILVITK